MKLIVIGAGLAGSEAAWQAAERGIETEIYEMKPAKRTAAHQEDSFGELVCSNSLRGERLTNAPGLLKEELRRLGSLIITCADATRVPAGSALAVDRHEFSRMVTTKIMSHPKISVVCREAEEIPKGCRVIVATGPLTSGGLEEELRKRFGKGLSFFDASAPIVTYESIDMDNAWFGARYGRGGENDYINCPMDKEMYISFREELMSAKEASVHGFEDKMVFEGCMPVEVMARRGEDALRYGPLRPVGLRHPETGKGFYAVLQLRRDNAAGSMYNMVGFQTHLTYSEQKRVFSIIPALKNAEFMRYGVMHRNTYIDSPRLLTRDFALREDGNIRFAGQISGVEGYIESTASGLVTGVAAAREILGQEPVKWPEETAIGALCAYISDSSVIDFQPMNINFGLFPPMEKPPRNKHEKHLALSERALAAIGQMV